MSTTGADYDEMAATYEGGHANAETEILDAQIIPGNTEKSKLLNMFNDLRTESTFCDVAFLCKGKLFRAHRIVVSGWSRWLRALLSEGNTEEVVHLDVFEPDSFSAILDYMYGASVTVTVDTAETLLKVIRRLELHGLEQSVWIFLMKAIDEYNCNRLHELADRYDCPPLKLAAWRYIQQAISGPTKHLDLSSKKSNYKGTGLTGPGEPSFYRNVSLQERSDEQRHMNELVASLGGIISAHSLAQEAELGDEEDKEQDADDKESIDLNISVDPSLDAVSFVKAWSKRLTAVYDDCMDIHGGDAMGSQTEAVMQSTQRSILLGSRAKSGSANASRTLVESVVAPLQAPHSPARRAAGGSGKHSGKPAKATAGDIDWHSELKGFYLGINLPEKLPFLDEILQANAGKEEQMLSHLMMRYKRVIPQSLANHLDTLQGFLETHSEF